MFLMSRSTVSCNNLLNFYRSPRHKSLTLYNSSGAVTQVSQGRRKSCSRLVPNAKRKYSKSVSWWNRLFSDSDGNWFGLKDEDMFDEDESESSKDEDLSPDEKFEAWRSRAEAIVELREAQDGIKNEEHRKWEDWLVDGTNYANNSLSWVQEQIAEAGESGPEVPKDPDENFSPQALAKSVRNMILGREDDELLYEDRVFQYASFNSAKFLAVLIIVPWALDCLVHDYVLMPFLDRYVKTVPLAAELLDLTRRQKLELTKEIKHEKDRFRFEVEIGKSPPVSDDELWLELHDKALELREEKRLRNRSAFANVWSDMVFGISLFTILYLNQSKIALLKFTGYKIVNNISDVGKALTIMTIADFLLGFHSELAWYPLVDGFLEHYGIELDESVVILFVSSVPVLLDVLIRYWIFKYLPRLSVRVAKIIDRIVRH